MAPGTLLGEWLLGYNYVCPSFVVGLGKQEMWNSLRYHLLQVRGSPKVTCLR